MKKRLILLLSTLIAVFFALSIGISADTAEGNSKGVHWALEENTTSVEAYDEAMNGYTLTLDAIDGTATIPNYSEEIYPYSAPWDTYDALITEIKIGKGITAFAADNFFNRYYNLDTIEVDSENTAFTSKNGILFNKKMTKLISYPQNKEEGDYTVPSTVRTIGNYAFYNANVKKVKIPSTLTKIGANAFEYSLITHITIPDGVTKIDKCVFNGCSYLVSVKGMANVKTIGTDAFCFTNSLTSINIPDSVTKLGFEAFGYSGLKKITGFKNVEFIGSYCFSAATNLKQIGDTANVITLAKVNSIGNYAFLDCYSIKKVVAKDKALTKLGTGAFYECSNLQAVNISSTKLVTLHSYTFYGDNLLTTVTISSPQLTTIGKEAFYANNKLTKLKIYSKKLTANKIGTDAFVGTPTNIVIYAPQTAVKNYNSILKKAGVPSQGKVVALP